MTWERSVGQLFQLMRVVMPVRESLSGARSEQNRLICA